MKLEKMMLREFTKHLNNMSVLEHVIEILPKCSVDGPWIAGGSLHRTYRDISLNDSDVDVFFKDNEQLNKYLIDLNGSALSTKRYTIKSYMVSEWHHTFVITYMDADIKIQCVSFKYFESIEKLFESFDINLCRIAYDGHSVIYEENALNNIRDNKLKFNEGSIYYPSVTLKRMVKYIKLGYNIEDMDLKILTHAFYNSKKKAIDILDQDIFNKKPVSINTYEGLK